jgi:hypothetical protein
MRGGRRLGYCMGDRQRSHVYGLKRTDPKRNPGGGWLSANKGLNIDNVARHIPRH